MSTNIHFIATREIKVIKTDKVSIQQISFNEWQTPTRVTREIMESDDPIEAYKDWILRECSRDEEFPIYNAGKEHVAQFNEWLKMCDEEGYTVVAEAW